MIDNQIILLKFIQVNTNINWYYISYQYILSENFIKKFQNNVDCDNISSYIQKLSENFIREFQDKVNWYYISINQKLSINFKKKNLIFYFMNNNI